VQHIIINDKRYDAEIKSIRFPICDIFCAGVYISSEIDTPIGCIAKTSPDDSNYICGIITYNSWKFHKNKTKYIKIQPRLSLLKNHKITHSVQVDKINITRHVYELLIFCGYDHSHIKWRISKELPETKAIHSNNEGSLEALRRICMIFGITFYFDGSDSFSSIIINSSTPAYLGEKPSAECAAATFKSYRAMRSDWSEATEHHNNTTEIHYVNRLFWTTATTRRKNFQSLSCVNEKLAYIFSRSKRGYYVFFDNSDNLFDAKVSLPLTNDTQEMSFCLERGTKVLIDYIEMQPVIIGCVSDSNIDSDLVVNTAVTPQIISNDKTSKIMQNKTGHIFAQQYITKNSTNLILNCAKIKIKTQAIYSIYSRYCMQAAAHTISCNAINLESKSIKKIFYDYKSDSDELYSESIAAKIKYRSVNINASNISLASSLVIKSNNIKISAKFFCVVCGDSGFELTESGIINFFGKSILGGVSLAGKINKTNPMLAVSLKSKSVKILDKYPLEYALDTLTSAQNKLAAGCILNIIIKSTRKYNFLEVKLTNNNNYQKHTSITESQKTTIRDLPAGEYTCAVRKPYEQLCSMDSEYKNPLHERIIKFNRSQELMLNILPPPVIINLRQPENKRKLTKEQLGSLDQNVCLFIHGFNLDNGEFGYEVDLNRTSGSIVNYDFRCTVLRDANKFKPLEYSSINGTGAMNWLLNIENNLNIAKGFNGDNYKDFKRIVFISWPSKIKHITSYQQVSHSTQEVAQQLVTLIDQLNFHGKKVNIIAHSLGCGVCCQLLGILGRSKFTPSINKVFLFDAAVPCDVFNGKKHSVDQFWSLGYALIAANKIIITHSVNDNILGPINEAETITKHNKTEIVLSFVLKKLNAGSIYGLSNWLGCDISEIFNYDQQSLIYKLWRNRFNPSLPSDINTFMQSTKFIQLLEAAHSNITDAINYLSQNSIQISDSYLYDGLQINITPEKNRTELIVDRAFALLMVLEKSHHKFKPTPALGYYGVMVTDQKVQHAIATGKLQSWNCDKIISDHSAIKTPNSAQRVLYKKIVASIDF
jgi:pimeloyl-ACP methyl ester carboxylesterase